MRAPLCLLTLLLSGGALAHPADRRDAVVTVVDNVSPAVVHIGTEKTITKRSTSPFFDPFFGPGRTRRFKTQSLGSGVIVRDDGIIVTNEHVVHGASRITVRLADEREFEADLIGSDYNSDLAVLKLQKPPKELPTASLGESKDLMIGETVVAIGSPFGLTHTVTVGVLSSIGRSFKDKERAMSDLIQTDAAINPGNSGGPLLNIEGKIVGINAAIRQGAEGIGFAIPADKVRRIITELVDFGAVRPVWLGLRIQPLNPLLARSLEWRKPGGVLVNHVEDKSPADTAQLAHGDIIAAVNGNSVRDMLDFRAKVRSFPARSKMKLSIWRDGQELQVPLTPVEYPPKLVEAMAWEILGLRVKKPGRGRGLMITQVRPAAAADRAGLNRGDLILALNGQQVESLKGFQSFILANRDRYAAAILIRRRATLYNATLNW